jgi:hypothetical protein
VKKKKMKFERHFEIKRAENRDIDIAGEDEIKKMRIVTFEKGEMKMTLKGERDHMEGFRTGDNVKVIIANSQTELFKIEEQKEDE